MRRQRKSYHRVLGVARDALPAEVKRAYRELAKRYHPDRVLDPDAARDAEERLKEINAAWNDYLESHRDAAPPPPAAAPASPPSSDDDEPAEPGYEPPAWRRRRAERPTRDRYRTERTRAARDREARERASREAADEVRRRRDAEIGERVERDRVRALGIVGLVAVALLVFVFLVLLFWLLQ